MPPIPRKFWEAIPQGNGPGTLMERGRRRMNLFCLDNGVETIPTVTDVPASEWPFDYCAYYRPHYIRICLEHCGRPCGDHDVRNWTYPGNLTDREPYGVILHELGHHCDVLKSGTKHNGYYGTYAGSVCAESREDPISGYHPNEGEWFAEMFRVFATNPDLLRLLRPRTYRILSRDWKPPTDKTWMEELGPDCPRRIISSIEKKIRNRKRS